MAMMIKCIECHKWKPESEFRKNRRGRQCKNCLNEYSRKYRREHRGEIKEYTREYRREHRQEIEEYRQKHKRESKEYYKKYRQDHKEKIKILNKKYQEEHGEEINKYNRKYRENHREQIREYGRIRLKNPKHKLNNNISRAINKSLRDGKNGAHWEDKVDFTLEDLIVYLENRFLTGMTWANYGDWHIDHTIPISVFNFDSYNDLDFKRCWVLSNLRPMWAEENMRKHNKIREPFQPSLKI